MANNSDIPAKEYESFTAKDKLFKMQHDILDENISDNPFFSQKMSNLDNSKLLTKNQTIIKALNELYINQRSIFQTLLNFVKKFEIRIGDLIADTELKEEYNALEVDNVIDAIIKLSKKEYELPVASTSALGGIKVGNNLSINSNGYLSVPVVSQSNAGIVPAYDGNIHKYLRGDGTWQEPDFSLPTMSPTIKGGAKNGPGLVMNSVNSEIVEVDLRTAVETTEIETVNNETNETISSSQTSIGKIILGPGLKLEENTLIVSGNIIEFEYEEFNEQDIEDIFSD